MRSTFANGRERCSRQRPLPPNDRAAAARPRGRTIAVMRIGANPKITKSGEKIAPVTRAKQANSRAHHHVRSMRGETGKASATNGLTGTASQARAEPRGEQV